MSELLWVLTFWSLMGTAFVGLVVAAGELRRVWDWSAHFHRGPPGRCAVCSFRDYGISRGFIDPTTPPRRHRCTLQVRGSR